MCTMLVGIQTVVRRLFIHLCLLNLEDISCVKKKKENATKKGTGTCVLNEVLCEKKLLILYY